MSSLDSKNLDGAYWIGNLPSGWNAVKSKYLFTNSTEKNHPNEPLLSATQDKGVIPRDQLEINAVKALKGLENLKLVRKGDFVISLRSFQGGIEYSDYQGIISTAYTILRPNQNVHAGYIRHLFKSRVFINALASLVTGIRDGQNISYTLFSDLSLPLPPLATQKNIASFLDRKTSQIDDLIARKQRLIELLQEQRTALINRAVTKGLNPDAPMKDSGIEWLGKVPAHWGVVKLKHLSSKITDGEHISPSTFEEGIPLLSAKDVRERHLSFDVDKFVSAEDAEKFRRRCNPEKGDLLIVSRGATIGRVGYVETDQYFCLMGSVILIKPNTKINSHFLYFLLNLSQVREELLLASQASAQQAIYLIDIQDLVLPLPSIDEQKKIASYLENESQQIDYLLGKEQALINFLQEYRSSLISEVVTGKIDVPDEVPA